MYKKLLTALAVFAAALCLAVGFAGCETSPSEEAAHTEHLFGEWQEATPATCFNPGKEVRECACGKREERDVPALGHDMTEHALVEPTCTSDGVKAYWECSRCKKNYAEEAGEIELATLTLPALGHKMIKHARVEPTCTADGSEEYWECSRCKKNFAEKAGKTELEELTLDALGHEMTEHALVEPTCTSEGVRAYWECSRCKKNYAEAAGETVLEELTLAMLPHDTTKHERVEPTCTSEGVKEYWECSGCHQKFEEQAGETVLDDLSIEKAAHTFEEHIETPATCDAAGKKCQQCKVCGATEREEEIPALGHDMGEWEDDGNATCTENGTETKRCKRAECEHSETRTKQDSALGHDYDEMGVCRREDCGDNSGPVLAEVPVFSEDGTVEFGSYPQSEVKDSSLKAALTANSGTLPSQQPSENYGIPWNYAGSWQDYGYYYQGHVHAYMFYQDVVYQGEKYRGVMMMSEYRDSSCDEIDAVRNRPHTQKDNGYVLSGTPYWFKYDPIVWRVLEKQGDEYFLMSELALDAREFHCIDNDSSANGGTVTQNNYEYSSVRRWLNENFYETAFTEYQKKLICTTLVDNTDLNPSDINGQDVSAWRDCLDKVFLLSWREIGSADYGFGSLYGDDAARRLKPTDYACAQGVEVTGGYVKWWLRSPGFYYRVAAYVESTGIAGQNWDHSMKSTRVTTTELGVVPALRIRYAG